MGTGPTYDVSPDGQRFLFIKSPENDIRSLDVILNWDVEVKEVLAGKAAVRAVLWLLRVCAGRRAGRGRRVRA